MQTSSSNSSNMGPRVFNEKYHVVKVLGAGSYGTVMLAVDNFGNQYAIKEIKDSGNLYGVDGFSLREIALLKEIDHENVVKLFCLEYIVKGKFF
jgi:serine/threonine protein kinase